MKQLCKKGGGLVPGLWHCSSPFWLAVRGRPSRAPGRLRKTPPQSVTDTVQVDYSDSANWAYYAEGAGKDVDVFLICPTVIWR